MKNDLQTNALFKIIVKKTLSQLVLLLTLVGFSFASVSTAQEVLDKHLSLDIKKQSLKEVLTIIEDRVDVKFAYKNEAVYATETIYFKVKDEKLSKVLDKLLAPHQIIYEVIGTQIILNQKLPKKKKETYLHIKDIQKVVTGKVTSNSGDPIPGVNILLKGTNVGTITDIEGNYILNAPEDGILIFSFIGYTTEEVPVNSRSVIDIVMITDIQSLEELVVTALGVEKDPKSITYATQNVSGEEITKVKDLNFVNSLTGKLAGVVITKGLGPGSPPRVLLRGDKSFTGNSDPLFVLNGVPMPGGSELLSNINPEDIKSMQILKGASAAALYGSEAANGVILVTTKKGQSGVASVKFSSTFSLESAVDLPELQTTYGQTDPGFNDSWGSTITNGSDSHLKEFFKTGKNYINAVSFSNGNDLAQIYLSYANTKALGILPENELKQHNVNLRLTTQLINDRLSLDGSVNYTDKKLYNHQVSGGTSALPGIYSFPVGDDFSKYGEDNFEVWDEVRQMYVQNWPYIRNETFPNQNPYWVQNRNQTDFFREHTILSFTAKYEISDWLDIQGRATLDKIYDNSESRNHASTQSTVAGPNGGYGIGKATRDNLYSDLLLIGNKVLNEHFTLSATLGISHKETTASGLNLSSTIQTSLSFPNYFSVYALNGLFNKSESLRENSTQAAFGNATIGFKERVFLDVTGRNEWSSTVSESFFYPSVGLSYVILPSGSGNVFSFAKLRGSYAEVGNPLPFGIANLSPPHSLSNNGNINARGTLPYFDGLDTVSLKPERTKSFEFGTDLRFFNDKLIVNLTYYNATSFDQVFQIAAPAGSGAENFWINGGAIRNKGIEGILTYNTAFGDLKWTTSFNFSHNKNQIRELSNLLDADWFVLGGSYRSVSLFLTRPKDGKYGSYGDMFGKIFEKDENGDLITNADGLPVLSEVPDQYVGNANPDYLAGINNRFTYKNFTLSFLIDSRFGGGVFNKTEQWLDYKGLSKRTGEARDNGGVMVNGELIDAKEYFMHQTESGFGGSVAAYFWEATNIRLRELSIGYTLPQFSNTIKQLNLSLIGRNVFFLYKKAPFDPELVQSTSQQSEGQSNWTIPSTRYFGLTLNASF